LIHYAERYSQEVLPIAHGCKIVVGVDVAKRFGIDVSADDAFGDGVRVNSGNERLEAVRAVGFGLSTGCGRGPNVNHGRKRLDSALEAGDCTGSVPCPREEEVEKSRRH
jgi:hypothetical protein